MINYSSSFNNLYRIIQKSSDKKENEAKNGQKKKFGYITYKLIKFVIYSLNLVD